MRNISRKKNKFTQDPLFLSSTPDVVSYGMVVIYDSSKSSPDVNDPNSQHELKLYVIMPRYGKTLEKYFE